MEAPRTKRDLENLTLYELIGADGKRRAIFKSAQQAAETAKRIWPDQEQDEDRTGKGWDVQVVGCDG